MKLKRLLVIGLSLMMVLAMNINVFAEGEDPVTSGKTVIYLTKEFDVPQGVAVPTDEFKFTAEPVTSGENDIVAQEDYEKVGLTINSISFTDSDRKSPEDTVLVKSSEIDLAGKTYPRAGVYKWNITEDDVANDKIEKSDAEYILRVYVKNGEHGTEIETITVQKPDGGKTDASKEDIDVTKDTDGDGDLTNDGNDFRFVNKYKSQDITENPEDNTGAFKLTKAVDGKYADKTHKFSFTVNVTLPAGKEISDYAAAKMAGEDKTINAGANSVELADGEAFTITKLPEGTLITVEEAGTELYTPSYTGKKTSANGEVEDLTAVTGSKNGGLAVAGNVVVGSKGANVAYVNALDDNDVTPTGIVINNLPYILLIALALGGIVLFARKRRYDR